MGRTVREPCIQWLAVGENGDLLVFTILAVVAFDLLPFRGLVYDLSIRLLIGNCGHIQDNHACVVYGCRWNWLSLFSRLPTIVKPLQAVIPEPEHCSKCVCHRPLNISANQTPSSTNLITSYTNWFSNWLANTVFYSFRSFFVLSSFRLALQLLHFPCDIRCIWEDKVSRVSGRNNFYYQLPQRFWVNGLQWQRIIVFKYGGV